MVSEQLNEGRLSALAFCYKLYEILRFFLWMAITLFESYSSKS